MSKTIEVASELLLYALKYSIANEDVDKDKVIISIANNMEDLGNYELEEYIHVIEASEIEESKNSEYTWFDLKEIIEKELYVRESVKGIMDILERKIN